MDEILKTGFDTEMEEETMEVPEPENKPRPFLVWTVKGTEYKLKLTTQVITKLEKQFGASLMSAVLDDGIPTQEVIIAMIQGAMLKFNHGIKSETVMDLLDDYKEEGHTIMDLLGDVIYALMYDAGFFTEALLKTLKEEMKNIDMGL